MTEQKPVVLATAELTIDMVDTLKKYFDRYAVDGVVAVEITTHGLWLPNPNENGRQFLGLARLPRRKKGQSKNIGLYQHD